jgi:hypothetical protein
MRKDHEPAHAVIRYMNLKWHAAIKCSLVPKIIETM